jgi:hypothetical protein
LNSVVVSITDQQAVSERLKAEAPWSRKPREVTELVAVTSKAFEVLQVQVGCSFVSSSEELQTVVVAVRDDNSLLVVLATVINGDARRKCEFTWR